MLTFTVADDQATSSIQMNVSQIAQLADQWNSDSLKASVSIMESTGDDANVGNIKGNRMFYDNDYMVR